MVVPKGKLYGTGESRGPPATLPANLPVAVARGCAWVWLPSNVFGWQTTYRPYNHSSNRRLRHFTIDRASSSGRG